LNRIRSGQSFRALLLAAVVAGTSACAEKAEDCWPQLEKGHTYSATILEAYTSAGSFQYHLNTNWENWSSCGASMAYPQGLELQMTIADKLIDEHGGCTTAYGPIEGVPDVVLAQGPEPLATDFTGRSMMFLETYQAAHAACGGTWAAGVDTERPTGSNPMDTPVPGELPPAVFVRYFQPTCDGNPDCSAICACSTGSCSADSCSDVYVVQLRAQ
jgi:hypothetical protein